MLPKRSLFSTHNCETIQLFVATKRCFHLSEIGNRRNRRSRKLETPFSEKETSDMQVQTPNPGNVTSSNSNGEVQESLENKNLGPQLTEQSHIGKELQVSTHIPEQKNNE